VTLRPGDANEVVECWKFIMQSRHEPVALILTRQPLPTLDRTKFKSAEGVRKGGYVLAGEPDDKAQVLLIGTGSEVYLCVAAHEELAKAGIKSRVISIPSWELFEHQSDEYKESVLPKGIRGRVCVEQASSFGWERYAGDGGAIVAMKSFGASAPLKELQKKFGFTVENIVEKAKEQAKRST
jgi:transketolase